MENHFAQLANLHISIVGLGLMGGSLGTGAGGPLQAPVGGSNQGLRRGVMPSTVNRLGVGDVLLTAGQSNAACFGSPTQAPKDDRVSTYTLAAKTWRLANDPQPDNSGGMGSGGSPWPILGSLLISSNQGL